MQINPLVTIAIPAYKSKFLFQAITSVLNQTYHNLELIIVNDNSPDNICSIIESFQDVRIRYYINVENIGAKDPVMNWNKCLSYANGDFFSLICDDDVYEPTFIESLLTLSYKYPSCNVFRSRACVINSDNEMIDLYPSAPELETSLDYIWHRVSGFRSQTISEFMYRRKHILELGGYVSLPMAWCSDDVSIYVFSAIGGIVTCNDILAKFRMSGLNITTLNDKNTLEKVKAQNIYTKWIIELTKTADESIRSIIIKVRENREREVMTQLLSYANWTDYFFLLKNRNSKMYYIKSRCFLKSLYQKIANRLKANLVFLF